MVPLSVKQKPLLRKQSKVATPSMCHAEYTASLHVSTAALSEEGGLTFKEKADKPFHTGAGKARKTPTRQQG